VGSPRYTLHAPPLRWRTWDEAAVVHHEASGSTHFLDPLSAAVLRSLEDGPAVLANVAARAAEHLGIPDDDDVEARVALVLEEFDRLGLAERVP